MGFSGVLGEVSYEVHGLVRDMTVRSENHLAVQQPRHLCLSPREPERMPAKGESGWRYETPYLFVARRRGEVEVGRRVDL